MAAHVEPQPVLGRDKDAGCSRGAHCGALGPRHFVFRDAVATRYIAAPTVQCPDFEVRKRPCHPLERTSESEGHWRIHDSSADFGIEVPGPACDYNDRNFEST